MNNMLPIDMTFINNVSHESGNKTTASNLFPFLPKNQNQHFTAFTTS